MQSWVPEALYVYANLRKKRRPNIKLQNALRLDSEEQSLVKEVREAKKNHEARLNELKAWRLLHRNAF